MHNVFVTVDVDWAPDWAMNLLLDRLLEQGVRSTWFVTHDSPVLDRMREHRELVELGIHPNFQSASSHGSTPAEVVRECMRMVPEAVTARTHCLVQSTPIFQTMVDESPIGLDTSLYLRGARDVEASELPLDHGNAIVRLPYVWEDDLEFFARDPQWDGGAFLASRHSPSETTVIDVHPIHFALNSCNQTNYKALKSFRGDTRLVSQSDAADFVHRGRGTATFIASLIAHASDPAFEFNEALSAYAHQGARLSVFKQAKA